MTVCLTVQESSNTVPLTLSESTTKVLLSVSSDEEICLSVATPLLSSKIPSNYGLITWNGSYMTVS